MSSHDAPPPGKPARTAVFAQLDEIELVIEKLVQGGEGLGRVEGVPLLVPRVAPGDRVRVRIVERRPDYGRGEVIELLAEGPGRRRPPCSVFDRCGGCDLQHLEDELQTRLKVGAAREALARLGGVVVARDARVVRGAAWGYRIRTQIHVERTERLDGTTAVAIGFRERGSDRLVETVACPILEPRLEAALPGLQRALGELSEPPRRIDVAAAGERLSYAPVIPGLPNEELETAIGGRHYRFDARVFFQAHRDLVADLVEVAVGSWEQAEGTAYDLYAGVGLFSVPLAVRYRSVVAVEGDRAAVRYARMNVRRNKVRNVEIEHRTVESFAGELPETPARVLVDPPRRGLSERVRRELLRSRPARLTYVSCQPATLARDLRALAAEYEVEDVVFLELFPQTAHLETVVQLVRRGSGSG
jgi:23S rRNA (uracil1939-C5)-methyltransferase